MSIWHVTDDSTPPAARAVLAVHRGGAVVGIVTTQWGDLWTASASGSVRQCLKALQETQQLLEPPMAVGAAGGRELRRDEAERAHRHTVGLALTASAQVRCCLVLTGTLLAWHSCVMLPLRLPHRNPCRACSRRLWAGALLPLPLPHRRAVGRALTALRHMRCCGCRSQTLCVSPGGGVPRPLQRRAVGRAVRNVPRHTMRRSNLPYKVWPLLCACA